MLPPDESPVRELVIHYRKANPGDRWLFELRSTAIRRAEIWTAAATEESRLGPDRYRPCDDVRVKWLLQWCDVLDGQIKRIDDRLTSSMEFACGLEMNSTCSSATISGKDRAAGEHLELETLAQGS